MAFDDHERETSDEVSRPTADASVPPVGADRDALDARDLPDLDDDPGSADGRTEVGLDETFPASDTPSTLRRECGDEPPASSGYTPPD